MIKFDQKYLFESIPYDVRLDMKLDYTISRIFQEVPISDLETPHHLCELERIPTSLALANFKNTLCRIFIRKQIKFYRLRRKNIVVLHINEKKYHPYIYLWINDVTKESQFSTKIKYILLTHFLEEHIFGIQLSQVDLKTAAMLYS